MSSLKAVLHHFLTPYFELLTDLRKQGERNKQRSNREGLVFSEEETKQDSTPIIDFTYPVCQIQGLFACLSYT